MNALQIYMQETAKEEIMTMNFLQDRGLISDECVHSCDVASADQDRAIKALIHDSLFGESGMTAEFMHTYKVKYQDAETGETKIEPIEGVDAGSAFARCQKQHPGATMLQCTREQVTCGKVIAWTEYCAPAVQRDPLREPRPCRTPRKDEKDGVMPFYDECISERQ